MISKDLLEIERIEYVRDINSYRIHLKEFWGGGYYSYDAVVTVYDKVRGHFPWPFSGNQSLTEKLLDAFYKLDQDIPAQTSMEIKGPMCECGAEKTYGSNLPGWMHSSFCPLFIPPVKKG
jgi:hypothetical protein